MPTATLTSKGQVTIPLSLRTLLGLHAGAKLDFVQHERGFTVIPVSSGTGASLKGRFAGRVSRPVSVAAMNRAIADEAASLHRGIKSGKP